MTKHLLACVLCRKDSSVIIADEFRKCKKNFTFLQKILFRSIHARVCGKALPNAAKLSKIETDPIPADFFSRKGAA
ncbi:MAG: hypothetical protein K6F56_00295 [Oscillospiraceae bacterium]|nr:hypothetical protein [Oscillospiraceae bacterium]